ncbi:MAG: hypothetical protein N2316_04580 [Spirochaetes bacterium]|nr:hypothetical protein [Spirochaetota bacterium]
MEEQKNNRMANEKDLNYLIALQYTGGDEKSAREMVEGKYRDLYVIKGTFKSSSLSGAILLFYNIKNLKLIDSFVYVTTSPLPHNLDPQTKWWEFERVLVDIAQTGDHDDILMRTLREGIVRSFTRTFIADLNRFLESKDEISLNRLIQKVIQDALGLQRLIMNVIATNTTSLEVELKSIITRKLEIQSLEKQKCETDGQVTLGKQASGQVAQTKAPKVGVDGIKLILEGSFILSPIKGKDINKLQVGDRVRINIVDKNPKAIPIAKAFNAYDEQNKKFLPVDVRIRQIERIEGKGIEAYALLAKGILVHLFEEEENIKVAMDPNYVWQSEEEERTSINIFAIIIILSIFAILIGIAIALLKLL